MFEAPLQAIDNVLMQFHLGHFLIGAFVLSVLGVLPLKSMKVVALVVVTFGAIFMLTPIDMTGETTFFRMVGIGLIVVGPMVYAVAES